MSRDRLLALGVLPPLAVFTVLMGAAMALYPGGTWEDLAAPGHSHLRNYLCDLERPVALNGQDNALGAACATWGLLAFSLALAPFFLLKARVFPDKRRLGTVVALAGVLASLGGVGVVLLPSYRVGSLVHGVAVLLAAGPGLTAALCATLGTFTTTESVRALRACAALTLLLTAASVAVFARQLALGVTTTTGLPVLEKLALLGALAWMVLTVARVAGAPAAQRAR